MKLWIYGIQDVPIRGFPYSINAYRTLQDLYNGLQAQKDRVTTELGELRRTATPRPDWGRCGLYVEGGPERWTELSEGRSSDGMLNVLLAQMAGMDESEVAKGDPFTGRVSYCACEGMKSISCQ